MNINKTILRTLETLQKRLRWRKQEKDLYFSLSYGGIVTTMDGQTHNVDVFGWEASIRDYPEYKVTKDGQVIGKRVNQ